MFEQSALWAALEEREETMVNRFLGYITCPRCTDLAMRYLIPAGPASKNRWRCDGPSGCRKLIPCSSP